MSLPTKNAAARMESNSSFSNSAAASTISLYQKYSELNQGIEKARQERTRLEELYGTLQEEILRVEQQGQSLQEATEQIQQDRKLHLAKQKEAQEALDKAERQSLALAQQHQVMVTQRIALRQIHRDYQLQFLQESHQFRFRCKGLKLRASTVHLPHAFQSAYASSVALHRQKVAHVFDVADNNHDFQSLINNNKSQGIVVATPSSNCQNKTGTTTTTTTTSPGVDDGDLSMVETWEISNDEEDATLAERLQDYKAKKEAVSNLQKQLEKAKSLFQEAEKERTTSLDRQDQLQEQVDRISFETTQMNTNIHKLRQETDEAKRLTETFSQQQKPTCRSVLRQPNNPDFVAASHHSQPAPPPTSNPYKKSSVPNNSQSAMMTMTMTTTTTRGMHHGPFPAPSNGDGSRQQHNCRRRRDNFGSSLLISGDLVLKSHNNDEEYEFVDDTPSSSTHRNYHRQSSTFVSCTEDPRPAENLPGLLEDDDDDDDDLLLSTTGLAKRSRTNKVGQESDTKHCP